jgi:hypothetical protein
MDPPDSSTTGDTGDTQPVVPTQLLDATLRDLTQCYSHTGVFSLMKHAEGSGQV